MKSISQTFYLTLVLAVVFIIGYFVFSSSGSQQTFSSLQVPEDPEHAYPGRYLSTTGQYQRNFWGDKVTIKGLVTNRSSHTNYKDVLIRVSFYSKTNSIVESKNHVLYEYFTYGGSKEFKLKVPYPREAASCGWEVVGATYY